jgi:hypothetical protein
VASAGYTFDPATGNTVSITFPATNARYLRANITANTGWPAGQVSDFEVFATTGGTGSATLTASPESLTFGSTTIGANSAAQTVTVANTGTAAASVSSVAATGDFTLANTCGTAIAAGANCIVTVTFHPTASGNRTGSLTIVSTATNSPLTMALAGTGAAAGSATLTASSSTLTFPQTTVGGASAAQTVTVANNGSAAATVSGVAVTGDYTQSGTCGTSIAAGANCTVSVTFHPNAAGTRTGSLTVTSNATNSPLTVALTGTGAAAGGTNLALGKATSQSSNTQTYVSANATDGNADTYWESANNAFPQWLQVDLGSTQSVSRIVVKLPPATAWATRSETIAVSGGTDGTTFAILTAAAAYPFDPATGNTVTITFPAASVRYLRITITANTGWPAGQVSELEVYTA